MIDRGFDLSVRHAVRVYTYGSSSMIYFEYNKAK